MRLVETQLGYIFDARLDAGALVLTKLEGPGLPGPRAWGRIGPDYGGVSRLAILDATPAERLALHFAGFDRINGLEIEPSVPTRFDNPAEEQAP